MRDIWAKHSFGDGARAGDGPRDSGPRLRTARRYGGATPMGRRGVTPDRRMRRRPTSTLGGDHAVGWADRGVVWELPHRPGGEGFRSGRGGAGTVPLGMAYDSEPSFRVLHALRIKGFAKVDVLSDLSAVDPDEVEQHLADFQADEITLFREARALWQLTPKGREVHAEQLAAEAAAVRPLVEPHYPPFLEINEAFKELCGDWQLRGGAPNDHTDAAHDEAVIGRLLEIINRLVDDGNTVIVIEHNLDVIKNADWIIDMGPEGGNKGGKVIFEGTPKQLIQAKQSLTGTNLKNHI